MTAATEPDPCVCDLWQYGVSLGNEDNDWWWSGLDDPQCACGHTNHDHNPDKCRLSQGKGPTMAAIPKQRIEQDMHGPYIVYKQHVYRPFPSVNSPGVAVLAFNKKRDAAEGTLFHTNSDEAISPARKAGTMEDYIVVNTRDKAYGPTGLRELWCLHRIPVGNAEALERWDNGHGSVYAPDHWNPLHHGVAVPHTAPLIGAVVAGVDIPANLYGLLPNLEGWIATNVLLPKQRGIKR